MNRLGSSLALVYKKKLMEKIDFYCLAIHTTPLKHTHFFFHMGTQ